MNILNREIIRHILGSLGLVPPPNFGKVGITTNEFKTKKTLTLEFEDSKGEDQKTEFALWSGKISLGNPNGMQTLKILATDICDNEQGYHEFIMAYRLDEAPIHAIKHIYSDNDALFLTKVDEIWRPVGTYEKLIACAGFERMTQLGLSWLPCDEYDELYSSLVEVVEM